MSHPELKSGYPAEAKLIPGWKRWFDIGLSVLATPLWVPFFALLALYIRVVSRGPVMIGQERVGLEGRRFTCYKFRTLRHVSTFESGREGHLRALLDSAAMMTKLDALGDLRIIPGGRLLRATGVDELPQIWNVLRGEMSLVGPRPCTPSEYEYYKPWHNARLAARPGLTGLWQVSGKNKTTFEEMVQLDIYYAQHQSLWLDLRILLRTFPTILAHLAQVWASRRGPHRFLARPQKPDSHS